MKASDVWFREHLYDYWDRQTGAVEANAKLLASFPEPRRQEQLDLIQAGVREHAGVLSDERLLQNVFVLIEDLYKQFNTIMRLGDPLFQFLTASSGTLLETLKLRGFALQYVVDNTFPYTEIGLGRPLHAFPALFEAAGLLFICPQQCATLLMKADGLGEKDFVREMPRYVDEGRLVAGKLIARAHEDRRHFAFLEADANTTAMDLALVQRGLPGILWVYRNEPPVAGSRAVVVPPEGVTLQSGP